MLLIIEQMLKCILRSEFRDRSRGAFHSPANAWGD
jgi:hypothetical protein